MQTKVLRTHLSVKIRRATEVFQLSTPRHHTNYTSDFALTQTWMSYVADNNQRHVPTHSKAFATTTKGIYLHNARHLPPKFTHSMAFARQDPPWHRGFSTFCSMITPNTSIYPRTQRHLPPQPRAFTSTTQGICLQNSRTQWHLPAKIRRDMEVFQLVTPWSHQTHLPTHSKAFAPTTKGAYLHNARHLPSKFTHSMAFARQDPAWHGGFSTCYSMITPNISTHAHKGICPHNQRRLPPPRKAFASEIHALNGICPPRPVVTWRLFNFLLYDHTKNRVQWVFPFSRTNYSSDFTLTLTWMSCVAHCKLAEWSLRMPRTSTTTPAGLSLDLYFKDCPWMQTSTVSPSS